MRQRQGCSGTWIMRAIEPDPPSGNILSEVADRARAKGNVLVQLSGDHFVAAVVQRDLCRSLRAYTRQRRDERHPKDA